jgi:glycosyltransferase involved in cell wall biosynthesis
MDKSLVSPKVSVCVMTYNQEKYIRECLQSVVDQETNFNFEVIVADDCSTDGTRAIIKEFAKKYPVIIKPIFREKNIGAFRNFVETHELADSDYVCHLDGDDYWFQNKLQIQSDILDNDEACNIVWTRSKILDARSNLIYDDLLCNIGKRRFNRGDLIQYGSIAVHSSKMYRNKKINFTNFNFDILDHFADIEQIKEGYGVVVDNFLTCYRYSIGISKKQKSEINALIIKYLILFHEKYQKYKLQVLSRILFIIIINVKNKRQVHYELIKILMCKEVFMAATQLIMSINFRSKLRINKAIK